MRSRWPQPRALREWRQLWIHGSGYERTYLGYPYSPTRMARWLQRLRGMRRWSSLVAGEAPQVAAREPKSKNIHAQAAAHHPPEPTGLEHFDAVDGITATTHRRS